MLSAEAERLEALAVRGEEGFDIEKYGVMCDRLGRVFQRVGLRRVASTVPSLADYLAAKSQPVEIDNAEPVE